MYIDSLGRVPALNQNRVIVTDARVFEVVNEWAVTSFPVFVSQELPSDAGEDGTMPPE
jgi:hypothetical protein